MHTEDALLAGTETLDRHGASTAPTVAVVGGGHQPTARANPEGAVDSLERGALVGRYTILSPLGRGGVGVVYAAYDPELDRKVAVKLLAQRTNDPVARANLLREAQAMAQLAHPNVVAVHDAGTVGNCVWIAMELVSGRTLTRWLAEHEHGWREILATFRAAGEGLRAAHSAGLVHHDFKPDNVMVDLDGRVRVMDFGLARLEQPTRDRIDGPSPVMLDASKGAGTLMGTPLYMAPEQWEGGTTDARTDQFSYCVALWEALHGDSPFAGDTLATRAHAVLEGKVVATPGRAIPGWLRRVILRGLERDPGRRWSTTEELLSALGRDPTGRNRLLAGVGASIVVVAGFVGWARIDEAERLAACDTAARAVSDDWNEQIKREVEIGMQGTDAAFAGTAFAGTATRLDEYAHAWASVAREACVQTTIGKTMDLDTLARTTACLEDRRVELAELVTVLRAADRAAVQEAVIAAAGLSEVAACTDPVRLAHQDPAAEASSDRAVAVRRDLARVRVLELTGRYAAAADALAGVGTELDALELPALRARFGLAAGSIAARQGDLERARGLMESAYHAAGRHGADTVALDAAVALAQLVGFQQAQHAAGLGWAKQAEMWLDRLGSGEEDLRRAALATGIGLIHHTRGEHADAIIAFERALSIYEATLGQGHPEVAIALNNLGFAQEGRGSPGAARETFLRALEATEAALGLDHPGYAVALNNLGAVSEALGDHDAALAYHLRALAIDERTLGPTHPDLATSLNNIGMVHQSRGEREEARDFYRRALAIRGGSLGASHPDVAGVRNNLATLQLELGEYAEALDNLEASLAVLEATLGPAHPDVAVLLVNIGRAHELLGADDDALAAYRRGLSIGEDTLAPGDNSRLVGLVGMGKILLAHGESADALDLLEQALGLCEVHHCSGAALPAVQFLLARALVASGNDASRARTLAKVARESYAAEGDRRRRETADIDAWLAQPKR